MWAAEADNLTLSLSSPTQLSIYLMWHCLSDDISLDPQSQGRVGIICCFFFLKKKYEVLKDKSINQYQQLVCDGSEITTLVPESKS